MPSDRLFRFSFCGILFIASLLFFYYFFGDDKDELLGNLSKQTIAPIIGLFLSTPVIGIIISSFAMGFLYWREGTHIFLYAPHNDEDILKGIFDRHNSKKNHKNLPSDFLKVSEEKWDRKTAKKYYPFYESEVRRIIQGDMLQYLERRWSSYWTNVNNIASIVLAFLIASLSHSHYIMKCFCSFNVDWSFYKIFPFILICAYIYVACWHAKLSRREGIDVEHLFLRDYYLNSKNSQEKK